jgi:DNA-binding IclR family transcriptional regulator
VQGTKRNTDPQLFIPETRLTIGARFGVYIQLLRLVARSPYWRSASVLMPLSQLSEECRLGVRQLQRYLAELREAGWLETRFHGSQGNEYFLKQF